MSITTETDSQIKMQKTLEAAALAFQEKPGPDTLAHLRSTYHAWKGKDWAINRVLDLLLMLSRPVKPELDRYLDCNLNNIVVGNTQTKTWTVADWNFKDQKKGLFIDSINFTVHEAADFLADATDAICVELYTYENTQDGNQIMKFWQDCYKTMTFVVGASYQLRGFCRFDRPPLIQKDQILYLSFRNYGAQQIDALGYVRGFVET